MYIIVAGILYAIFHEVLFRGILNIEGGLPAFISCGAALWLARKIVPAKKKEQEEQTEQAEEVEEPEKPEKPEKPSGRKGWEIACIILLLSIAATIAYIGYERPNQSPVGQYQVNTSVSTQLSTEKPKVDTVAYYKENYPMSWGYISKNYATPDFYIGYYDLVWGELQEYHGDGIKFETLNSYEQTLVNYPRIQSRIYFANKKTKEYHSTSTCYTLLKSQKSIVSRNCDNIKDYDPCSKCVGDTQHINKVRAMYGYN